MAKKEVKVTVYSTPTCPYCHMAKDFLIANKSFSKDVDVSSDSAAAQEMMDKSGTNWAFPLSTWTEKIIGGFRPRSVEPPRSA